MPLVTGALGLSWRERFDAARALWWLLWAHACVRLLPWRRVRQLVGAVRPARARRALSVGACAKAIARAAVLFPPAQCLARAIAAECLLRRAGRDAELRLGVGFDEAHAFQAHAWLVSDGVVVTGGGPAPAMKTIGGAS